MMEAVLTWRPSAWVDYLLIYMVPGVLVAACLLINKWRTRPSEFAYNLMSIIGKNLSLWDRLKELLVFFLAIFCVLVGWPAFFIWLPFYWRQQKRNKAWQAIPDFDCAPQYLVHQVTPTEAESLHVIHDPLGFVPEIAFGHMNKAWKEFVARIESGEELWSFLVPKGGKTGKYQFEAESEVTGYARIKDGAVVEEFLY